ncbi:MAG TPA: redoxin domain-containing protein [Anaerolineales bacterium]
MAKKQENVIQQAEQLLREGKGLEARSLMVEYIQQNPTSAQGWWLLSQLVADEKQQIDCLERVIQFDPNYFPARTRLEELKDELAPKPTAPFYTASSQQVVSVNRNAGTHLVATKSEQPRPVQRTSRPVKSSARTDWILLGASFLILMSIIVIGFGFVIVNQLRQQSAPQVAVQPTVGRTMVSQHTLPTTWIATVTPPVHYATFIAGDYAATSTPQMLFKLMGPSIGLFAPDFTLTDVASGNQVSMSNYTGKAVLLYFWATWCPHCANEVSSVQSVYSQYKNKGFAVLAVDVGENAAKARNYRSAHGLTFSILNDSGAQVAGKYRISAFPTNFFITSNGQISSITIGELSYSSLNAKVSSLLPFAQ